MMKTKHSSHASPIFLKDEGSRPLRGSFHTVPFLLPKQDLAAIFMGKAVQLAQ